MRFLFILLLSGCQIWTGAAVRPLAKTEVLRDNIYYQEMKNPVFVLKAEQRINERNKIYYEHDSAAFSQHEDSGLNFFGWLYRIK